MKRTCALAIAFLGVLLFAQSLLAQYPNISNGTCYYGPEKQANSKYIPCGNAALAHFTCCEGGDMCLSNNACYNVHCKSCPRLKPVLNTLIFVPRGRDISCELQ